MHVAARTGHVPDAQHTLATCMPVMHLVDTSARTVSQDDKWISGEAMALAIVLAPICPELL